MNKVKIRNAINNKFNLLVFLALISIYLVSVIENPLGQRIRSDGHGYYAYLPALIIYSDPSFQRLAEEQFGGEFPRWTGIQRHPDTGRYLNKFNLGVALFISPFFMAAHSVTWLMRPPSEPEVNAHVIRYNFPMDGYSPFYQHAAGLAGMFYCWIGFLILRIVLLNYYPRCAVNNTLLVLLFGTNVLDFGALTSTGSHSVSFMLFALFLYVYRLWVVSGGVQWSIILGLVMGSIVLVRVTNVIFFAIVPLVSPSGTSCLHHHVHMLFHRWREILVVGVFAAVAFMPQMFYWNYSSGSPLINSYGSTGLPYLTSPKFVDVLFGIRKGIFIWFPVLCLLAPGLMLMYKKKDPFFKGVLVIFIIQIYIISSALVWYAGASFGQRYISEYLILLSFPLTTVYASTAKRTAMSMTLYLFSIMCCMWTLLLFKAYITREINIEGIDASALRDLLWWRFVSARSLLP